MTISARTLIFNLNKFNSHNEIRNFKYFQYHKLFCKSISTSNVVNLETPLRKHDSKHPYLAPMKIKRELHKGGNRSCLHIEFDINGSDIKYEAGDHLVMFPVNNMNLVNRIEEIYGTNLNNVIPDAVTAKTALPQGITYRTALKHYLEINTVLTADILKKLSKYYPDATNNKIQDLKDKHNKYTAIEMLEILSSMQFLLDHTVEILPILKPRYYSISSSPKLHPSSVHITAVVVKFKTSDGKTATGATTGWLADHEPNSEDYPTVPIYIVKSQFRLPENPNIPIVMICQGTGLAPFRSFIQERHFERMNNQPVGNSILYFGCRHKKYDFLYQEELEQYADTNLIKLYTAFSRDQHEKVYVTHLLHRNQNELWDVINNKKGHVYVCGNMQSMAKDVRYEMLQLIQEKSKLSLLEAEQYLKIMEVERRYLTDAWS